MALCLKKKNKAWIWLAVDRETTTIVAFAIGCRGARTGKKLWNKVKHLSCNEYMTDYWEAYQTFLPSEKHTRSKAETYTVEGMNNLLRHFIARFKRKTHCYSKSKAMVANTLLLFMYKDRVLSMFS